MYCEEETELRDLIMQNLENCGFLNKIKAEIRASVFLALEEDGNLKDKVPLFNQKFDNFLNTPEGKLTVSLIHEFLEYFALKFTLSVFEPEIGTSLPSISRTELCDKVNLKNSDFDGPVILGLLKNSIGNYQNFSSKSSETFNFVPEKNNKSISNDDVTEKDILENFLNHENPEYKKDKTFHESFDKDFFLKSSQDSFDNLESFPKVDLERNGTAGKAVANVLIAKDDPIEKSDNIDVFKKSNDDDDDSFFDKPLPSEKTSFFTFSDSLKDKSEAKLAPSAKKDTDDSKKSSLASLKDLPSLTANHEWSFSRDPKNALPSLDSLKSVTSSEASNEEIINLDSREMFEKKDLDIAESNEELSEKQNSEESIEEEIDESSVGFDDLLASSLSLADDVTTDQTVSQVSVVEGVDHVEPCK